MSASDERTTAAQAPDAARHVDRALGRLPLPAPSFVGRAVEITDLASRLWAPGPSRLATLTGPSGIGKTHLAIEVARRVAPRYPHGAWLIELAPVADPALVPRAVVDALHVRPQPGRDPVDLLLDHLASRQALLVLDNCEHLLVACSALCTTLLASSQVTILATSQRVLDVADEHVVTVAPMSLPDPSATVAEEAMRSEAVRLFCMRAEASAPSFRLTDGNAPDVVEICRRLEGIPLAIELAAARSNVLAPVEIAERLVDRFRLLSRGPGNAPTRHQTLRASIDWSYDLLSPAEATLLRRLAVFAGGAPLKAIEEVCAGGDLTPDDVVDHLSELADRSLLVADPTSSPRTRIRLLETVREYGRERMAAAGELHEQQRRHAEWCLSVCATAEDHRRSGRAWDAVLQAELDNVISALRWAVEHDSALGVRLAIEMYPFWKVRGELREGQGWLERTLGTNRDVPGELRSRALQDIGMLAVLQGDVATATSAVEESLAVARRDGIRTMEALSLNLLGFISIFSQDPLAAMPLLEESVALNRAIGEVGLLISALALYGRAHLFVGETDAARRVFEECLELAGGADGDDADIGLIGLGWAAFLAGEQREARSLFGRALPLVRAQGDRYNAALVLSFLGDLAWTRGDLAEARASLDEGLALARAMGAPFPTAKCLAGLARVAAAEGDHDAASRLAGEACRVARESRLPYAAVRCQLVHCGVDLAVGDLHGAQEAADEALTLAQGNGDEGGVAAATLQLARVARARGNDERAASLASEALAIQLRLPDSAGLASSLELLAGMLVRGGRLASAARLFGAAEAIRRESGSPCPPDELDTFNCDVGQVRAAAAADPELEEAWASGATLTRCEAVLLASRGRGRRNRPAHGWAALTPAERQVAELAVLGLTNNEIGEKLFVSPRTVQGHLLRIFPKLGVRSRRQLRGMVPGD
jgi:predicted ATPase/DNA-binding CsgD family transcriptional regulator